MKRTTPDPSIYKAGITTPKTVEEVWVHGHCPDGTGAAVVATMYATFHGKVIPIVYLFHGESSSFPDATNKKIAVFDFSFDEETLVKYLNQASEFSVYDHHESAKEVLEKYPTYCKFNIKQSGVSLAWQFFFGAISPDPPRWAQYIEDRDLWRWKFKETKAFGAYVNYYTDKKPETLFNLFYPEVQILRPGLPIADLADYETILSKGASALIVEEAIIKSQLVGVIRSKFLGHPCGVINATCLVSDTCDQFLKQNDMYNLVLSYRMDSRTLSYSFSLRSRETSELDCIPLAQKFKGGGHKHAAGFKLDGSEPLIPFLQKNMH